LSNTVFSNADFLVTNALNNGLAALVNLHNFEEFANDPFANTNKFYAIWQQVAAHYSNSPPQVAFELDNEPHGTATTAILNPIYAEAIRLIRLTNPTRTIFVGPSQWNSIPELNSLLLPDADSNLVVTVHCYDPFMFTHQGASWGGADVATLGVLFPGPPPTPLIPAPGIGPWATNWITDYNSLPTEGNPSSPIAFRARLQIARQWADYYGRPVHVGEFGAYSAYADALSRARFYTEFRSVADSLGLGWAMWDWKAGFHYWNDNTLQPVAGMRAAVLPSVHLVPTGPGRFEFASAVAKTFVIERTPLLFPVNWTSIQTQTLSSPTFNYTDPGVSETNSAFYRTRWVK
jgi:endoglucanase